MGKYEFTIIASGLDHADEKFFDRFYEAGCDDSTIAIFKGRIVLEFEREAKNFAHALSSAIRDVLAAGAKVEHIEPDYLVSLSDIAERTNLSKAAISLYAKGERGREFPAPVLRITSDSPLWSWVDVSRWMYQQGKVSLQEVVQAQMVRDANLTLFQVRGRLKPSRFGSALEASLKAA